MTDEGVRLGMKAAGIVVDEANTVLRLGRSIRGRIGTYLTVWCGLCMESLDVEAKAKAKAGIEARSKGWVLTKKNGWICPKCAIALLMEEVK